MVTSIIPKPIPKPQFYGYSYIMEKQKAPPVTKKTMIPHVLDSPCAAVPWPPISMEIQTHILDILCNLLIPIGQYRSGLESPSKGKRSKKRKRQTVRAVELPDSTNNKIPSKASAHPPPPSLMQYLNIGFNANTRHLEALVQSSVPGALRIEVPETNTTPVERDKCRAIAVEDFSTLPEALVAIFVPRSDQPALMHGHLPLLIYTASLARPSSPAIRLIGLPKGAEASMSSVLGIPRTGFVGLRDNAPDADSLVKMIREHVPAVEVPWLQEIKAGRYLPVNINVA